MFNCEEFFFLVGLSSLAFLLLGNVWIPFDLNILKFPLAQGPGLFEPIHGSAPDIAGQVGFPARQIILHLECNAI